MATITVPPGFDVTETVAAVGVTPSSLVLVGLAPAEDADENDPEMLDLAALSARPGTDQLVITAAFAAVTSGPVKVSWSAF